MSEPSYRTSAYVNSVGPCGASAESLMGNASRLNAAFSTYAWEAAKQEGCLQCPGSHMPQWPPRFMYPQQQVQGVTEVLGACPAALSDTAPPYETQARTVLESKPYSYQGADRYYGESSSSSPCPGAAQSPAARLASAKSATQVAESILY